MTGQTQPHIAFDTLSVIGRDREKAAIEKALAATGSSQAILVTGPGGIGKTRLLRWAVDKAEEQELLCSGIVDLYHPDTHSNSGIERTILLGPGNGNHGSQREPENFTGGIDPKREYFAEYWERREEFEHLRQEGVEIRRLEELRRGLTEAFVANYNALADQKRITLVLDTAELIQFESDLIQHICQIPQYAVEVKTWLTAVLPRLKNTVILLAGRGPRPDLPHDPRRRLWDDIESALSAAQIGRRVFELDALNAAETIEYFDAVAEAIQEQAKQAGPAQERKLRDVASRIQKIPPDARREIHESTGGRPIRLGLAIDLILFGDPELTAELFQEDLTWDDLEPHIVKRLQQLDIGYPVDGVLNYLACTRQGLDAKLLHHLESGWSISECQNRLTAIQALSFVKVRPGTDIVFLHDEMYNLLEKHLVWARPELFQKHYAKIIEFYQQQLDSHTALDAERERLQVILLHYRLRHDPKDGYETYYRWSEEAIKSHQTGLDMKLRGETLQFHAVPQYQSASEQRGWPRAAIDRDCAVRWVKRHIARNAPQRAAEVAEIIMAAGPDPYASLVSDAEAHLRTLSREDREQAQRLFAADDPYFWAHLLTYYAEALLYLGRPETDVEPLLRRAIDLLATITPEEGDDFKAWLRARISGRAHNNIGYLHRTRGRYGQALRQYQQALDQFEEANIEDELADSLNNLAFLEGLLGRVYDARRHIEPALAIRERIGREYPLALSHNTRGRIYTFEDHPDLGEQECREALTICRRLGEQRGIGLTYNGLGFALRKGGDQWKLRGFPRKEDEDKFEKAAQCFTNAIDIFSSSVTEPIRLWEAYNELGSLYCDWGWLTRHRTEEDKKSLNETALQQYDRSIEYQQKALAVAREHLLSFQEIDSLDDLAQVYADRSFLLTEMDREEEAGQSRAQAEDYQQQIEKLVPSVFHLRKGRGFREAPEPGEAYWLALGKLHMWRGVWKFRDVEGKLTDAQEREQAIKSAIRDMALAVAYFQRYWPSSFGMEHTLEYVRRFVRTTGVKADVVRQEITQVAETYKVNLGKLDEVVTEVLKRA